jgi:hypothetical protein
LEAAGTATRFHCEKNWCWRAAEVGADPTRCLFPRPPVTPDEEEMLSLLRLCSSQTRASFGGIMGFDWLAVEMVAKKLGIDTGSSWWGVAGWWEVFRILEAEWLEIVNKPKPKESAAE